MTQETIVKVTSFCGMQLHMTLRQTITRLMAVLDQGVPLVYGGGTLFLSVPGRVTRLKDGNKVSKDHPAYENQYLIGFDVGAMPSYPSICNLVALIYLTHKKPTDLLYGDAARILGDAIHPDWKVIDGDK